MQDNKLVIRNFSFITEIDYKKQLVFTRWTGKVTFEEIRKYMSLVWDRSDTREFNECIDFRDAAKIQISSEEINMIAEAAAEKTKNWRHTRISFIVSDDLKYGLGRMYSTLRKILSTDSREVGVFRDEREAIAWIEELE